MSEHHNRGAKRAREARAKLGLDPIAPLPCLLECVEALAGFPVVVASLAEGVAGACTGGRLLWVNGTQALVRQRFTLAHELGHAWCKHDGKLVVDTIATLSGRDTTPYEITANAFAAELLIPRAAFEARASRGDPTLDEIVGVAARYGTSALMTLFRFGQHRLASSDCVAKLRAAIEAGEHGAAYERLDCETFTDRLAQLPEVGGLPYLSAPLRGGRLAAVLRGEAEADPGLATAITRLLA